MIYTLTIKCIFGIYLEEECIRVIEIEEDSPLFVLHHAIQEAIDFGKDHPYEFYAGSGYRNKQRSYTDDIPLNKVYPLNRLKLYYLFDFGDYWTFEIRKGRKIKEPEPGVEYPRLIESIGPDPEQYPYFEEDE
ncbi:MAG: plasmid pRiA4b ORF-3 family protein [bacterium]|nr:plasmid pRiA4b ORF-3 family protein [bacterium]